MKRGVRWQDWATMVLGVMLIVSPFVSRETSSKGAVWSAVIIGAALLVLGAIAAYQRDVQAIEYLPAVTGIVAIVAPWLFSYTGSSGTAWTSWIVGVLAMLTAGSVATGLAEPSARQRI